MMRGISKGRSGGAGGGGGGLRTEKSDFSWTWKPGAARGKAASAKDGGESVRERQCLYLTVRAGGEPADDPLDQAAVLPRLDLRKHPQASRRRM